MNEELPEGWAVAALGEIGQWGSGGTPTRTNSKYYEGGTIPWLVIGDLTDSVVTRATTRITTIGLEQSSAKLIPPGTLLVAMYGSIGKLGITGFECATNQAIAFCLPDSQLVQLKFLFYSLMAAKSDLVAAGQGGTQQNISQGILKKHPVHLAPIAEQQRIADKLDTLLARVDACRERLDRVPAILKRFRQSVLAAATSGELTADWREERRIKEKWPEERAADVCEKVQSGGTPKAGFSPTGVPFLKVYNIVGQRVDFESKPQFVTREVDDTVLRKSKCTPGDVLMNIVGPPLGKVAIVPDSHPSWNVNQAITLFRPSSRVRSKWLYVLLSSGRYVESVLHETKGTVGQVNISLTQCRNFRFPVPSVHEQDEIVRRVEALLGHVDRLESGYRAARSHVERLTPALLAKAFRGELVPQDPDDESADTLLERIRAGRDLEPTPPRQKRR